MSIMRYDPFRDLKTIQEEMNRLFSTSLSGGLADDQMASGAWSPSVDIHENKDQIVLEAELPGMNREDFDLSVENNVLTLRGERRFEKKSEQDNYHRVERAYGSFVRSFTLPQSVTSEGAQAEYKNGVLRVVLPKREEVKARRIEIAGEANTQPRTIEAEASDKDSTADGQNANGDQAKHAAAKS